MSYITLVSTYNIFSSYWAAMQTFWTGINIIAKSICVLNAMAFVSDTIEEQQSSQPAVPGPNFQWSHKFSGCNRVQPHCSLPLSIKYQVNDSTDNADGHFEQ